MMNYDKYRNEEYRRANLDEFKELILQCAANREFFTVTPQGGHICGRVSIMPISLGKRSYVEVFTFGWPIMILDVYYNFVYINDNWNTKVSNTLCNRLKEMFPSYILVHGVDNLLDKMSPDYLNPHTIDELSLEGKIIYEPPQCPAIADLPRLGNNAVLKIEPGKHRHYYELFDNINRIVHDYDGYTSSAPSMDRYNKMFDYLLGVNVIITLDENEMFRHALKCWLKLMPLLQKAKAVLVATDKSSWQKNEVECYDELNNTIAALFDAMPQLFNLETYDKTSGKVGGLIEVILICVYKLSRIFVDVSGKCKAEYKAEFDALDDIIMFFEYNRDFYIVDKILGYYCRRKNTIVLYYLNIKDYANRYGWDTDEMMRAVYAHEAFHAMHYYEIEYAKGKIEGIKYWEGEIKIKHDRETIIEGLARCFEYYWSITVCPRAYAMFLENNNRWCDYPFWPYSAATGLIDKYKNNNKDVSIDTFRDIYQKSLKDWDIAYLAIDKVNRGITA